MGFPVWAAVLALLLACSAAAAEEGKKWICVGEASTGFKFMNGRWQEAAFRTDQEKYIVTQQKTQHPRAIDYKITQLGSDFAGQCRQWPPFPNIKCNYSLTEVIMNAKTLRFIAIYSVGYIDGKDAGGDTPVITIGKCSPL